MSPLSSHPLVDVNQQIRQLHPPNKALVVFDLDSTLFCVSPRTQKILRQLAERPKFLSAHPEAAQHLREVSIRPTDWGIRAALERLPLTLTPALIREVRNHWRSQFFANQHLDEDSLYPGAVDYVRQLHEWGAEIYYLTGRNAGSMRLGTERNLKRRGFPLASSEHLLMKPDDIQLDEQFKAKKMQSLAEHHRHIWFFENEPLIIHQVRAATPQVHIVFVDSVHSGRATPPTDLPTIGMDYRPGLGEPRS